MVGGMLFHVLGPLEVRGRDGEVVRLGGGKAATVLTSLLLHPNAWISSAQLIDATWQEKAAPASAEANLKTYVWQLRRLLPTKDGEPRIESRPGAYRLRVFPGELDAQRAEEDSATARELTGSGEVTAARRTIERALRLWRGRPYEGQEIVASCEADRLTDLYRRLRDDLADVQLALGCAPEAVQTLRTLTDEDPLRETTWARLIDALRTSGRNREAVAAYEQARNALATELGVRPGRALSEAYRAALGQATTTSRRELPRDPACFTARDDALADIRLACAAGTAVVLLDGMPGIGKTALAVHAAHGLADSFPDGQFFLDLGAYDSRKTLDVADALDRLLRSIGVPPGLVPDTTDERAALWRSELAHRRVLLVLDDAADAEQVEPLLPSAPGSLTLVTTRNRGWHAGGAARVGLEPLSEADSVTLFRSAVGERADSAPSHTAIPAVVRQCGGVPAALHDAAAKLHSRSAWTPVTLARELEADPCQVLATAHDRLRRSVAAAAAARPPADRPVVGALGRLSGEFELAAAARVLGGTAAQVRPSLEALVDVSLLDALPDGRYRCNALVRHHVRCRPCTPAEPRSGRMRIA